MDANASTHLCVLTFSGMLFDLNNELDLTNMDSNYDPHGTVG